MFGQKIRKIYRLIMPEKKTSSSENKSAKFHPVEDNGENKKSVQLLYHRDIKIDSVPGYTNAAEHEEWWIN